MRRKRRHGAARLGPVYDLTAAFLEPTLSVITSRDRRGMQFLEADYPPHDGVVVASNHLSWFDPMNISHVLWDAGRPPRFLAKDTLFRAPGIGFILSNAGQIPVYRGTEDARTAVSAGVDALERGETIVVYPEGTMTRDPDLWPMKGRVGAAQLGMLARAPVIPVAQWGPQEIMGPYRKEFNVWPRKVMKTSVGPPVDLAEFYDQPLTREVLTAATERIMLAITRLLEELRGESAPAEPLDFRKHRHNGDRVPKS